MSLKLLIPSEQKNGVTVKTAMRLMEDLASMFHILPSMDFPDLIFKENGETNDVEKAAKGVLGLFEELYNLYNLYEKCYSHFYDEIGKIMLEGEISLRDYHNIFVSDPKTSVASMMGYWSVQEQYNVFVDMTRSTFTPYLDNMLNSLRSSNKRTIELLTQFAKKLKTLSEKRRKQYDEALEEEIDFWGFLREMPGDLYEFTNTEQVKISAVAGLFAVGCEG